MFRPATVELYTSRMPQVFRINYEYETCIFTNNDSEVLDRYNSLSDAIEGHIKLSKKYNLRSISDEI